MIPLIPSLVVAVSLGARAPMPPGAQAAVIGAVSAQPARAGGDATAQERATYRGLVRDIRRIDGEYEQLLGASIEEAKSSESGTVGLERQAELINLRDERDRLLQRLQLLSLRHGWDMPDFEAGSEAADEDGADGLSEKEQVFASAADEIRTRAAREARMIAERISLPITPVLVPR